MFYYNHDISDTLPRFSIERFMEFNESTYDTYSSYLLSNIDKLEFSGIYTLASDEKNPPLISYNIYKDVQYWWILMMYNGIIDHRDLTSGKLLNYFSISSLEKLFFTLNSKS